MYQTIYSHCAGVTRTWRSEGYSHHHYSREYPHWPPSCGRSYSHRSPLTGCCLGCARTTPTRPYTSPLLPIGPPRSVLTHECPHDWSSAKLRARCQVFLIEFYLGGHRIPDLVPSCWKLTDRCPHGRTPTRAEDQRQVPLTDLGSDGTRTTFSGCYQISKTFVRMSPNVTERNQNVTKHSRTFPSATGRYSPLDQGRLPLAEGREGGVWRHTLLITPRTVLPVVSWPKSLIVLIYRTTDTPVPSAPWIPSWPQLRG